MISAEVETAELVTGGRLGELYVRHAPGAIRLAYLLTGERALAEDLVQEAFTRLAARFLDLRGPDAFEAYLRKTVVNLARSHFRHRRVERNYLDRVGRLPEVVAYQPDVDQKEALREALLRLNERQRTAIVLRFYADLSEAQTAKVLGCRIGTVKSLVSRGMSRLRVEVGDE